RGRHDAGRPDPVAPHDCRPFAARLVEVCGAQRLRVAGAELEDVADLDRALDLDRVPARRDIARLDRADIELLVGEVAPGAHADQVRVGLVGTGEVPLAPD